MGLEIRMAAAITTPEAVGVLVWWGIMLAAPPILLGRWRRRRNTGSFRGLLRISSRRQPEAKTDVDVAQSVRPCARLARGTLEPLCRYVDFRRRLELAVCELEAKLSQLPLDRWRIEPYPLTGERRNTLLLLGENGVFVVSATYAPGHWDDVIAVNKLARKVQLLLPGYAGEVQPAICHPFTPTRPRLWHRADNHGDWIGAWLLGGDSVIEWLEHFGAEKGLSMADLERFDQLSKPNWLKAAIPTPPSWPPIHETAPSGSQG